MQECVMMHCGDSIQSHSEKPNRIERPHMQWARIGKNRKMKSPSIYIALTWMVLVYVPDIHADMGYEGALAEKLFTNYSVDTRPVDAFSTIVLISFTFVLAKIERLDEKNQQMISFGWMNQQWRDEHLVWLPEQHGGVPFLVVPAEKVWRPEVSLYNSMENFDDLSFYTKSRILITPDGQVMWVQGLRWVTQCTMQLRNFPFDTQECSVRFINWQHSENLLNFTNTEAEVRTGPYEANGEWDLISTRTFRYNIDKTPEVAFPVVGFTLKLQRIPTYFLYSILIPVFLLTILTGLVFLVPNEAGEKISMQITILLSHSVMLLVISDTTPRSATTAPILTEFMVCTMSLSAVSLIGTVVTLRMYHHSAVQPVPLWIRRICLNFLARLLLMKIDCMVHKDKVEVICQENQAETLDEEVDGKDEAQDSQEKCCMHAPQLPDYLKKYIMRKLKATEESSVITRNQEQWQMVSAVLDRLFFVMYAIVVAVIFSLAFKGLK